MRTEENDHRVNWSNEMSLIRKLVDGG